MLKPIALPPTTARHSMATSFPPAPATTTAPAPTPTSPSNTVATAPLPPLVHPAAPAPTASTNAASTLSNALSIAAPTAGPPAPGAQPPRLLSGQPWPEAWSGVWVPFETWARQNRLGSPVQMAAGPEPVFTVGTPEGMIRVRIGQQVAHLLTHDCLLSFPPRLISGVPYLHSLDLLKTVQPLLTGHFELPATNRVIVIDPGHGGRDSGTRNAFGSDNEKVFTLDWARRLESILIASGWTVIMTRTNDGDLSLNDRVAIAERAQADLFLSLHFNSGPQRSELNGLETYCLTPTGMPSNLRRDYEDDPREVHPNNTHDEANFLLASRLHRSLLRTTGAADRGVRRARFMTVLRGQNRPAVLVEGGYLSNPSEARRIATPSYRQLLAEAVAQTLNEPAPTSPVDAVNARRPSTAPTPPSTPPSPAAPATNTSAPSPNAASTAATSP